MGLYNNNLIPGMGVNVTLAQVDEFFSSTSEHAQSGKGVADAISNAIDQTYSPESKKAQSGKAVAEALNGYTPLYTHSVDNRYTIGGMSKSGAVCLFTDPVDNMVYGEPSMMLQYRIAMRQYNGNLVSKTPEYDIDVANKKYVDDAISKVESGGADLSNYYTKAEIDNTLAQFDGRIQDAANYGIAAQVKLENDYYTQTEIDAKIGDIESLLGGI